MSQPLGDAAFGEGGMSYESMHCRVSLCVCMQQQRIYIRLQLGQSPVVTPVRACVCSQLQQQQQQLIGHSSAVTGGINRRTRSRARTHNVKRSERRTRRARGDARGAPRTRRRRKTLKQQPLPPQQQHRYACGAASRAQQAPTPRKKEARAATPMTTRAAAP